MSNPLVSIILTSYNQPGLLERAFTSLINQTYINIEIVIVDDCSTDRTNKILIEKFKALYPGKVKAYFQQKNVGIPANKNAGFRLATGEYITYLDGDDTYYEDKIATEINTFLQHPGAGVVYSNFDIKDMDENILSVWATDFSPSQGYIFKDIILNNFPDCHTHRYELFRKNVLWDLNFYDEQFPIYEDLDLMIRYSLKYKVAYNNYIASSYFKNPKSIVSKTQGLKLIEQQERIYKKHNAAIREKGIEKQFKKYLDNLKLDKQFYINTVNYPLLFKALIKQPHQIIKIAKIINYVRKTRHVYN